MKEITAQMVEFAKVFPDGVNLYDFAEKFRHLTDEEYAESLNRAVRSRKIRIKCFSVYPKA